MADEFEGGFRSGQDTTSQPLYGLAEPGFLKQRINTADILLELKMKLLGKTLDENGNWMPLGSPLMNEEGVNVILSIMNCYFNTSTLFAELTREDINYICYGLNTDLVCEFVSNKVEWNIKNIPLVKRAVIDFVFMTLTRAQGRGEAESIGRLTTVERVRVTPEEKKSRIPFFGKRGDNK